MDTYKTIIDDATTEFTEKHSRFIGYVSHTETDEEAIAFIEKIRSIHSDARHNVYAYVLNKDNRMRFSDDGEPHGTAGKPILDIINSFELRDITLVVTRYFGGILLGTGGLVRAYTKSAKDTLELADKYIIVPGIAYSVYTNYSNFSLLESLIKDFNGSIENIRFEDNVFMTFSIPVSFEKEFTLSLTDTFFSSVKAEKIGEKYTKQKI